MSDVRLSISMVLVLGLIATTAAANMVDFDAVPPGSMYGVPAGHIPGDVVLTQDGIDMSVERFFWLGGGVTFNSADIVPSSSPFAPGPTQALHTNNINAQFDFSGVGFPVKEVSLEFVDFGGNENFDVNGVGLQNVNSFTGLTSYPGQFDVIVTPTPLAGGLGGTLLVRQTGPDPVKTLLIGGQEFGIDTLRGEGDHGHAMPLLPGDADQDLDFDQLDLVQVQQAAKYLTGLPATWGEGDWDGAPGGQPGNPPVGNGFFDQFDIIAAQQQAIYLTGPYATLAGGGLSEDFLQQDLAADGPLAGGSGSGDMHLVSIPEPTTVVLLLAGLALLNLGGRRHFLRRCRQ